MGALCFVGIHDMDWKYVDEHNPCRQKGYCRRNDCSYHTIPLTRDEHKWTEWQLVPDAPCKRVRYCMVERCRVWPDVKWMHQYRTREDGVEVCTVPGCHEANGYVTIGDVFKIVKEIVGKKPPVEKEKTVIRPTTVQSPPPIAVQPVEQPVNKPSSKPVNRPTVAPGTKSNTPPQTSSWLSTSPKPVYAGWELATLLNSMQIATSEVELIAMLNEISRRADIQATYSVMLLKQRKDLTPYVQRLADETLSAIYPQAG